MCLGCYIKAGSPVIVTDATKAAASLIAAIYEFSCVGGNAHIVVDDWNLGDENIDWCLNEALKTNFHEASIKQLEAERAALTALRALTVSERYSAMALHDKIIT